MGLPESRRPTHRRLGKLRRRAGLVPLLCTGLAFALPRLASACDVDAAREHLASWGPASAAKALADCGDEDEVRMLRGELAIMDGDYAAAVATLLPLASDARATANPKLVERAQQMLAVARASVDVLAGGPRTVSPDGRSVVHVADAKDAGLAPYLFDAAAAAMTSVAQELGVTLEGPVRFEVYADPLDLAKVSPLTAENIAVTGTVGIAKYGRVMMITPRVMVTGYGWIDTAIHEFTHLLVTRRTHDRAPVWLQEGLAKLFETRWRRSDAEPLDATSGGLLRAAIEGDTLVSFAEMYPSFAMLPSAERSSLAYAQVRTMLELLHRTKGSAGLAVLLDAVADGHPAEQALATAWGDSFEAFVAAWKRDVMARTRGAQGGAVQKPEFGAAAPEPELFANLTGKARQHARLGVLLAMRRRDLAASIELTRARNASKDAKDDPVVAKHLGRLEARLEHWEPAIPLLEQALAAEPEDAESAAALGRARVRVGQLPEAREPLLQALRINPFLPGLHCDLAQVEEDPARALHERAWCDR